MQGLLRQVTEGAPGGPELGQPLHRCCRVPHAGHRKHYPAPIHAYRDARSHGTGGGLDRAATPRETAGCGHPARCWRGSGTCVRDTPCSRTKRAGGSPFVRAAPPEHERRWALAGLPEHGADQQRRVPHTCPLAVGRNRPWFTEDTPCWAAPVGACEPAC